MTNGSFRVYDGHVASGGTAAGSFAIALDARMDLLSFPAFL